MENYVWTLILTSMAVTIVMAIAPKSALRGLLATVAGCVVVLALLKPLPQVTFPDLSIVNYQLSIDDYAHITDSEIKSIIEEKTSAYIGTKARELGLDCEVTVILDERNSPWEVILSVKDARLSELIVRDLGVAPEHVILR
ncbi:hypothetical protein FACS1894202_12940 [Clostridia bacterium]|nr:hypothetical protein FACS1894202_12940 [Clostridia bacterium]